METWSKMHWSDSYSIPPVMGRDAYERLGSAEKELVLFEHSIHHPHDTEPDRFTEEVVRFVEKYR